MGHFQYLNFARSSSQELKQQYVYIKAIKIYAAAGVYFLAAGQILFPFSNNPAKDCSS